MFEPNQIICGDCVKDGIMRRFPDNSFDSIVTDIPYGIGFMGKDWDTFKGDYLKKHREADRKRKPRTDGRTVVAWNEGADAGTYDYSRNAEYQEWCRIWSAEALRIAKPGAFLLCFGGTRTSHRLTCGLEDAGWQIRDCMMWLYGSGFPKSHNISKAIDKAAPRRGMFAEFAQHLRQQLKASGKSHKDIAFNFLSKTGGLTGCVWNWVNGMSVPTSEQWEILQPLLGLSNKFLPLIKRIETEREIVGKKGKLNAYANGGGYKAGQGEYSKTEISITTPTTPLAKFWDGYGTALKPAWEPIIVAMKPLDGTFAANAEKWGVAGLNIDGGRVEYQSEYDKSQATPQGKCTANIAKGARPDVDNEERSGFARPEQKGRWPANLILDEEVAAMLDEQSGVLTSGKLVGKYKGSSGKTACYGEYGFAEKNCEKHSGGASRFFYCAKASRAERNAGLDCDPQITDDGRKKKIDNAYLRGKTLRQNNHPTVKPLALMEYLCTLLKPPTEHPILLDPFCGSGTTLMAAVNTGWDYVGIEKEKEYVEIAEKRVAYTKEQRQGQMPLWKRD